MSELKPFYGLICLYR